MEPAYEGKWGSGGGTTLDASGTSALPSIALWSLAAPQDIRTAAHGTFTFQPPRDAFYGPHAVVAWPTSRSTTSAGNSLLMSARLLGVLDVLPDSGQSGTRCTTRRWSAGCRIGECRDRYG